MSTLKCNTCGRENPISASFCEGCGSPLSFIDHDFGSSSIDSGVDSLPEVENSQPIYDGPPIFDDNASSGTGSTEGSYTYNQTQGDSSHYTYSDGSQYKFTDGATSEKMNTMCLVGFIASLVSLLCCGLSSLPALILSVIGFVQAKNKGEKGKFLGLAGIIISAVLMLLFLILFIFNPNANTECNIRY